MIRNQDDEEREVLEEELKEMMRVVPINGIQPKQSDNKRKIVPNIHPLEVNEPSERILIGDENLMHQQVSNIQPNNILSIVPLNNELPVINQPVVESINLQPIEDNQGNNVQANIIVPISSINYS